MLLTVKLLMTDLFLLNKKGGKKEKKMDADIEKSSNVTEKKMV